MKKINKKIDKLVRKKLLLNSESRPFDHTWLCFVFKDLDFRDECSNFWNDVTSGKPWMMVDNYFINKLDDDYARDAKTLLARLLLVEDFKRYLEENK